MRIWRESAIFALEARAFYVFSRLNRANCTRIGVLRIRAIYK
jgi:hypothetical protein